MNHQDLSSWVLITSVICFAAGAASAGIPPEVAERLDAAVMLDESEDFVGSFTLTSETVVEKLNGKRRHEETMVISTTRSQDGTSNTSS